MSQTNPDDDALSHTLTFQVCKYGEHDLQRMGVWEAKQSQTLASSNYWLIFIHGGAWRTVDRTLYDFEPAIKSILADPHTDLSRIRGFASIDYRLSPNRASHQDPETTPPNELRNAKHPDHISDVRAAIEYLQDHYALAGDDYVLFGHSAGATLSFQLLMGSACLAGDTVSASPAPAAVIGLSGIYDLEGLQQRFPDYEGFIAGAFGERQRWAAASPACFKGSYGHSWSIKRPVYLALSLQDSLIDVTELDSMAAKLRHDGCDLSVITDLHGDHDVAWEDGSQINRLAQKVLGQLQQ